MTHPSYQQPSQVTSPRWQPRPNDPVDLAWRLHAVEMTLHGHDGTNGLCSAQKTQDREISALKDWRRELEIQWCTAVRIGRWAGISLLFFYGALGAGPTVEWASTLFGHARKIVGG